MRVDLRYLGKSRVQQAAGGTLMSLLPNLARERVGFDAELKNPVRFREAMSALHEVVVGDFRFKKRDKTAYHEWKAEQLAEEAAIRERVRKKAKERALERMGDEAPPPGLEPEFRKMHRLYWDARVRWAQELARNDPDLFRHLVPCDPVITVAPDVVFFEGFAKDESSYGSVYVDRDAFSGNGPVELGTTNVDYSMALYEEFQTLRTYRKTRLSVDPEGFQVAVEDREEYREEKIDLPPSWLRGFGQISAATSLPAARIELPVETVYSLLAHLKRNREKRGPRSLRFVLTPGKPPAVVIEPWEITVQSHGRAWDGDAPREVKVWGRRRLLVLARVLPLADRIDVHLLGSGLPSIWVVYMGELRFVLALSGWTANDFSSGSNLELLTGHFAVDHRVVDLTADALARARQATVADLMIATKASRAAQMSALHRLAKQGQAVFDYGSNRFRYRQILPVALGESLLGPEPEELVEARRLYLGGAVRIERREELANGRRLFVAKIDGKSVETILDGDGAFSKARCPCTHFHTRGLRAGACRHLLALRFQVDGQSKVSMVIDETKFGN
jgi:hypothetical protein